MSTRLQRLLPHPALRRPRLAFLHLLISFFPSLKPFGETYFLTKSVTQAPTCTLVAIGEAWSRQELTGQGQGGIAPNGSGGSPMSDPACDPQPSDLLTGAWKPLNLNISCLCWKCADRQHSEMQGQQERFTLLEAKTWSDCHLCFWFYRIWCQIHMILNDNNRRHLFHPVWLHEEI